MGQEYSQGGLNSVSYPEAIGYIERSRLKGKNKYNLKKNEIKSFSRIPYSKYVPLSERESKTYKQSLKPNTASSQKPPQNTNRKPGGRIVNISPPAKRKYAQNAHVGNGIQKNKNPVTNYKDKNSSSKAKHNVSISSNNSQGSQILNTSNASTKRSENGSLVSLKDRNTKTPGSASSSRSRFVPRNEKEAQLQKIYIKPGDLVVEMPRQKTRKSKKKKSENDAVKISKKKKALFKIRKKMKIDPTPVYLESPFKRQTTIRIKKNQVVPEMTRQRSKDNLNDSKSTTDSRPTTSKTSKRPNSSVSFSNQRPGSGATSVQLSIVGNKASLFNKDSNEGVQDDNNDIEKDIEDKDELTKLFEKRTHFPPQKTPQKKLSRPQTASEADATLQKTKKLRPKSSPYTSMAYIGGQIVYPGYKGKTLITKNNVPPKRKPKSAIHPLSSKQPGRASVIKGKVGDFNIVKGKKKNKNEPKGASEEPKVRLKWFNVLHRTHYQNRIDSLYNKDDVQETGGTSDNHIRTDNVFDNKADSDINSARSLNTYSDSCLTNTTVSTANATVVGELDRNVAEVDYEPTENSHPGYEPSLTSEFSVFSTRQTRVSGPIDYEGDGETDLDRPLKFKDKKSPDILRKDLLKMQESHFKNHPGLEEETDSSDSGTLTGNYYPAVGHVQKMRELFGALEYNKNNPHTRPPRSRTKDNAVSHYKPSYMNETIPSHLFMAKEQADVSIKNKPKDVSGTNTTNKKSNKNNKENNKPLKTVAIDNKQKSFKNPVTKNNNDKIKNTFITQNIKAKTAKTPNFLKENPVKHNINITKKTPQQNSKKTNRTVVQQQKKTPGEQNNDNDEVNKFTPVRQIIVSPFHSDDDDSLAELEDAATLAAKLLSANKSEHVSTGSNEVIDSTNEDVTRSQEKHVTINGFSTGGNRKDPNNIPAQKDEEEEDELDQILREIYNERKRRDEQEQEESKKKQQNQQQDIPFKTTASKTLNPVITYKKDTSQLHNTCDCEKPHEEDHNNVRRSIHFQSARAMFEQNKAMFDQDEEPVDQDDNNKGKCVPNENGYNEDDLNVLSSDQTVTIEGNYDDYARKTRTSTNKTSAQDRGGIHLPRIVNKDTYAMYSRHGPVLSKGGPISRNKAVAQDKDKSISAITESYKGTRYNGYSWKSNTVGVSNTNNTPGGKSLYSTLVQNRYQNSGAMNQSNKSSMKSVNDLGGGVNKRTAEITKF